VRADRQTPLRADLIANTSNEKRIMSTPPDETSRAAAEFAEQVRQHRQKLGAELRPQYDFIVCGAGSSGSVVAGRLAENPDVSVLLLLEAGGDDDVPEVMRAVIHVAGARSPRPSAMKTSGSTRWAR
jgi:choline dehydrogenase